MVAGEQGRNTTQPQVSAQDLFVAARADSFLPAGVFWVSERSPAITAYPLGFGEEWLLVGSPKSSIRIYGYSVIVVVLVHQISDSGDAGNLVTEFYLG